MVVELSTNLTLEWPSWQAADHRFPTSASGQNKAASAGIGDRRIGFPSSDGPLTSLEFDAWRGLLRTYDSLLRAMDREMIDAEGLSPSGYGVLLRLAQSPEKRMRMSDIADSLLLSRSGLTGIVNELERRGYVSRERSSDNGWNLPGDDPNRIGPCSAGHTVCT